MNSVDARVLTTEAPQESASPSAKPAWRATLRHLSFTNISVIYVGIALIVVFSVWVPETFPTSTTARSVLYGSAVPALMALALVIPLSAGLFDLSIGSAMGLANILVAWLLVEQGWGVVPAVLATVAASVAMGVFSGLIVVGARIDSFIGTLAGGALFATFGSILTTQTISGVELGGSFAGLAGMSFLGVNLPMYLAILIAFACWIFQRYTVSGRRIYAIGFNQRAAELVGIPARRLRFAALVASSVIVGIAGILLASSIGAGSPNVGPPYLLNAFAAAFLGATQFGGRFNVWGTILAVLLLTTGTNGIFLVGGAPWAQSLFSGVVLLLALGASNLEQAIRARSWVRAKAREHRAEAARA
jgi:ribose transport system permease protein